MQTTITIILTFTLSIVFAQNDCKKCDIDKVQIVSENLDNLTFQMLEDFLCTFDSACNTNIEYSEWSNEILYKVLDMNPSLFFKVIPQGQIYNSSILIYEIENPISDIDFQKIYGKIKVLNTTHGLKVRVLRALEIAANKEGVKIQK